MEEGIKVKGLIEITHTRDGKVIDKRKVENIITSAGKAQLALLAGDATAVPFTYLEVGIGTTAAAVTDTALESAITDSGLERAAATVSRVTTNVANDTLQLLKSWSVTGTKAITEAGAFNAASTGTLLGHQVFAAVNVVSGDTFALTYKFVFAV